MTEILLREEYSFIIDTDQDVHPFAETLCAYCTGLSGEEVSDDTLVEEMSELYLKEMNIDSLDKSIFNDCIEDRPSNLGDWLEPYAVWPSKEFGRVVHNEGFDYKRLNDHDDFAGPAPFSVGIYFSEMPTEKQIKVLKTRANDYFEFHWTKNQEVNIIGYRVVVHRKYGEEINV